MLWGIHRLSQPKHWIKPRHRKLRLRGSLFRDKVPLKATWKIRVRCPWKTSPNRKINCCWKRIIAGKVRSSWVRYRPPRKHQLLTRLQAFTVWAIILSKLLENPWTNQPVLKRPNRRIKFQKSRTKEDRFLGIQMIGLPSPKEEVKRPRFKLVAEIDQRLQSKVENLAIVLQENNSIWARYRHRVRLKKAKGWCSKIRWINFPTKRVHWTLSTSLTSKIGIIWHNIITGKHRRPNLTNWE